jgi:recombination protein RecT
METIKSLMTAESVKRKFVDVLGENANAFITSVVQITQASPLLAKAEPTSVMTAAMVAATLNLPINNNLGFAYIVPYKARQSDGSFKQVAQFQMGYKGFIQLAQRSGQFKTISAAPIYEGQLISQNPLTGFEFDFTQKQSDVVIGYAAYFKLLNGFEKTLFMTVDELKAHGLKYSKTYASKRSTSLWETDFDSMAMKTTLKLLLSRFAPLSIQMQTAITADQSQIDQNGKPNYIDHDFEVIDKEAERERLLLEQCNTIDELELLIAANPDIDAQKIQQRKTELNGK